MELISRVVAGWNVRIARNGVRTSKFFADAKHGGKRKALAAARAFRDTLLADRAASAKPLAPRPLTVVRQNATYVQIRIPKAGGGTTTTEFSARRHGPREARRLAIAAFHAATGGAPV